MSEIEPKVVVVIANDVNKPNLTFGGSDEKRQGLSSFVSLLVSVSLNRFVRFKVHEALCNRRYAFRSLTRCFLFKKR